MDTDSDASYDGSITGDENPYKGQPVSLTKTTQTNNYLPNPNAFVFNFLTQVIASPIIPGKADAAVEDCK